jgi:hypothetical protein
MVTGPPESFEKASHLVAGVSEKKYGGWFGYLPSSVGPAGTFAVADGLVVPPFPCSGRSVDSIEGVGYLSVGGLVGPPEPGGSVVAGETVAASDAEGASVGGLVPGAVAFPHAVTSTESTTRNVVAMAWPRR